jgi:tetratricopeptide (TPR) repeat protein
VAAAFAKTGLPSAERAAARVSAVLDDYARDWAENRTDACVATRIRKEASASVLDQRVQCFDRRLTELGMLADEFSQADKPVVERAVRAAEGLVPITACSAARVRADGEANALRGPEDLAIVDLLSRGATAGRLEKTGDASRFAQTALDMARARKNRSLEAEALRILGYSAMIKLDGQTAKRLLFDAFATADEVGAASIAASSADSLLLAMSLTPTTNEEADNWVRIASSAIRRAGGDDELTAQLAAAHAAILLNNGKFGEARDEARRAVRGLEDLHHPSKRSLASALNTLFAALERLGEFEEAKKYLSQAIELTEREYGPDHPRLARLIGNLGVTLRDEGNYEESSRVLTRALTIYEHAEGQASPLAQAEAAVGGTLAHLDHRYGEARAHLERAEAVARATPSLPQWFQGTIDMERGYLERREHRYAEALAYYTRGLSMYEASRAPNDVGTASVLVGLGRVHLERGSPRKALPFLERAVTSLGDDVSPFYRAEARFALAQALLQIDKTSKRGRDLAQEQHAYFLQHPERTGDVREIEAWFSKLPPTSPAPTKHL